MKTRDVGGLNPYILINSSFREMVAGRCGKTCKHVFSLPIGYYMSWEDSINHVVDRKVATIKTHSIYHIIPDPTDPTPNSVGNLMPSRHRMKKTYQKKRIPSLLNCWWTVFIQPPHRWSHLSPIWCWHFPFFGSSKNVAFLKLPKFIIIFLIFCSG